MPHPRQPRRIIGVHVIYSKRKSPASIAALTQALSGSPEVPRGDWLPDSSQGEGDGGVWGILSCDRSCFRRHHVAGHRFRAAGIASPPSRADTRVAVRARRAVDPPAGGVERTRQRPRRQPHTAWRPRLWARPHAARAHGRTAEVSKSVGAQTEQPPSVVKAPEAPCLSCQGVGEPIHV